METAYETTFFEILMGQGVLGALLFVVFCVLSLAACVVAVCASKPLGYALFVGAWLAVALLLVLTALNLLHTTELPRGLATASLQARHCTGLLVFLRIAVFVSIPVLLILSFGKGRKQYLPGELLLVATMILLTVAGAAAQKALAMILMRY